MNSVKIPLSNCMKFTCIYILLDKLIQNMVWVILQWSLIICTCANKQMSLRAIEGAPYRNFRFTKLAGNTGIRLGVWKLIPVERLPHLNSGCWQNQHRRFINHWSPGNVVELDWPHLWEAENILTDIVKQYGWHSWKGTNFNPDLTLISPGGCSSPPPPPRHFSLYKSAARIGRAARFHEFFPVCFAHILRQNLWRPGVRLQSYVTFSTCMSAQKSLKFVILCTNPMQIGILEVIHITLIFYTFKDIWSLLHPIFRTIGRNTEVLTKTLLGNLCAVFESVGSLFVELNWPLEFELIFFYPLKIY